MRQSRLLQQIWNVVGAAPIMVKVLGIVLGVIVLLGGFIILQMRSVLTETLLHEIEHQGLALSDVITGHLTAEALDNPRSVTTLLREQKQHYSTDSHNTSVVYIVIENGSGDALVSVADQPPPVGSITAAEQPVTRRVPDSSTLEIISPIHNSAYVLKLGLSTESVQLTVNTVSFQLLTITLVMVAVGFAAAFLLTWILTRPLLDLVSATHAVAAGDFTRRVPRWANDEIGELATAFNTMTESLQQAEAERIERQHLQERYVSGVIVAQENERKRIARELHDSTSQSLTSLLVGLENLKHSQDQNTVSERVDKLRSGISTTLDEVRMISWRLRPSALDDLGLVSALEYYIDDYRQRYQIEVDLVTTGLEERLPAEMETAIYRMVQEGLTNIARYANTDHASVIINRRADLIRIVIEDKGAGFDPVVIQQTSSLGLHGIRERASLFGGKLTIETQAGEGTTLYIDIPLNASQQTPGAIHDIAHSDR